MPPSPPNAEESGMGWAWTWVRCGQFPGLAALTTGESFGLIQVARAGMGILDMYFKKPDISIVINM